PELASRMIIGSDQGAYVNWTLAVFLSMMAVLFLPRQFQVAVVENVNENHLNRAIWLFPLYLLAINIFVLPVAFGGVMIFPEKTVDADTFMLTIPMFHHEQGLALFAFLGGMSAATGMVIVETVALSTMICNDLVMPLLLRLPLLRLTEQSDLSVLLLSIRRAGIVLVLLLGYAYYHFIGEHYTLVSIGLTSFTAVAQFAPAILGGIFWRAGSRAGALAGLLAGFGIWLYSLVLPSLADAGYLPTRFVTEGPFGIALLKPFSLFGLQSLDRISHAVFWSMLANAGLYIGISMFSRPSAIEHAQAALFVDVFRQAESERSTVWRGTASVPDLRSMLSRFLGRRRADRALSSYAAEHGIDWESAPTADSGLVNYAEKLLAGAIGSASARVMVGSIEKEAPLSVEEVMGILDETRQAIAYSRELERATAELKAANERLKELDRLKDEFLSTVTHELRTPLTSIRSIAEILHDNPDISPERHLEFTDIVVRESQRLTRLITQVLDFQRIESGRMDWHLSRVEMGEVIAEAVSATRQLVEEKKITLVTGLDEALPAIEGDRDRLVQVLVNLISNAVKFCDPEQGRIEIRAAAQDDGLRIDVSDNGPGIPAESRESIFEEFRQIRSKTRGRPQGTGLGLSICRRIIAFHRGRIWADSEPGKGATFSFYLPGEGASTG
ncbi:MAG: ATP-binding protein, partial [Desulfobacterales bacterium]